MVVIFTHVPSEGPGLLGEMLEGRGCPFVAIKAYSGEPVPLSPAGFSGVISMGGSMSVSDDLPFLRKEMTFLAEAARRKIPIMGICLGSQLLATALGAKVSKGSDAEIGWGEVTLTEEGKTDPLFRGIDSVLPVFHWHGETFDLPEGTVHLAYSSTYRNQAFRWGEKAYGFQFHLEVTGEMVEEWLADDEVSGRGNITDPEVVKVGIKEHLPGIRLAGSLVFGRFLDLLR